METNLRRTPLFAAHQKRNARLVDFAGWEMPVLYTGILEEARAVRSHAGIFDISHMGRIQVKGEGATAMLQTLTSNDVAALKPSEAQYSLLTNPSGGIIDDIIVYRAGDEDYLVVINASNTEKDLNWIAQHTPSAVTVVDNTLETAMIAVQGPAAPALVAEVAGRPNLLELGRFQYATGQIGGVSATFCRTGYTGEDGFEVIVPAAQAEALWDALLAGGAAACGLGARDALRIEAGYPLYGHEIDDTTSPVEAGLMWVVKLDKGNFIGRDSITAVKSNPPVRRLVGMVTQERIQPRQGYTINVGNEPIGEVTSGIFSPTKGTSIAMGYVAAPYAKTGTLVEIAIRDRRAAAKVVPKKNLLA
ncbi:MAG: glycine cleavage system protein [Chthonomonadaceae bacterium]|nr:glycine cleavage system protein [Chthonomonadaceae bacterium]